MTDPITRFEIGIVDPASVIAHSTNIHDAALSAASVAKHYPQATVYVLDILARPGQAKVWYFGRGDNALHVQTRAPAVPVETIPLVDKVDMKIAAANKTANRTIELETK